MRDNFLFEEIDVPLCLSNNLEDNKKSLIVFYFCSFGFINFFGSSIYYFIYRFGSFICIHIVRQYILFEIAKFISFITNVYHGYFKDNIRM